MDSETTLKVKKKSKHSCTGPGPRRGTVLCKGVKRIITAWAPKGYSGLYGSVIDYYCITKLVMS